MRGSMVAGIAVVALAALASGCPKSKDKGGGAAGNGSGTSGSMSQSSTGGSASTGNSGGSAGSKDTGKAGSGSGMSSGGGTAGKMGSAGSTSGSAGEKGSAGESSGGTAGSSGGVCNLACVRGKHCELVQVQCIRAPCPPQAMCVDDAKAPACGGIAARPCPGMGTCVDDPSDSCDPKMGGADCSGICSCDKAASCVMGKTWNGSPDVCACVDAAGGGPACGKTTCPKDQECCNASCGICTPPGGACTQQVCM